MNRIRRRPLPSRRITIHHAVIWSSSALLACQVFAVKYVLAASNPVLCYAFVYTSLKHIYLVNTWIGAVVGAIPPLPGSAATSGEISLILIILPDGLYFWQILHFMALAFTVLMEGSRCFDLLILLCLSASATWPMIWV